MPEIRIASVEQGTPYKTSHGTDLVPYNLEYSGPTGGDNARGQLSQKPGTPPPKPGEVIDVTLEDTPYGVKLKKVPKAGGDFNGNGGGQSHSPAKSAEIRRLACQKSAVALLVAEVQLGNEKPGTVSDLLKQRIDWLEKDCIDAGKAAS